MLLLLHVTVLFVAFDGETVALRVYVLPTSSESEVAFRLTEMGAIEDEEFIEKL